MKSIYLFPNKLKITALVIFIISLTLVILIPFEIVYELRVPVFAIASDHFLSSENSFYLSFGKEDIYNELVDLLFFSSGIILAFSKEKTEDEMIGLIRYKSITNATYFTFTLLIISEFLVFGMPFVYIIMFFYYAFILFLNIFYYTKLFIYKKQFSYENED